jgi:hypothetical protein
MGVAVGARVAVDVDEAACMPVQPENARQKTIKTMKICPYLTLMIPSH